jgi:hypothetical protein
MICIIYSTMFDPRLSITTVHSLPLSFWYLLLFGLPTYILNLIYISQFCDLGTIN